LVGQCAVEVIAHIVYFAQEVRFAAEPQEHLLQYIIGFVGIANLVAGIAVEVMLLFLHQAG
jgi:hypothetical protein